jgi:hypothetical protein
MKIRTKKLTISIKKAKTFRLRPLVEKTDHDAVFFNWLWWRTYAYR